MPATAPEIETTLKALKANDFDARLVPTGAEAVELLLKMIPLSARIGMGDSATMKQLGIIKALTQRGNEVINPFTPEITKAAATPEGHQKFIGLLRKTFGTDVFIASSNAITQDGKIVNIDRIGNRVAGIVFAAPHTFLLVGRNKIVRDVDQAIDRIKNVISAAHNKRKGRRTPCAIKGVCTDCNTPERICNVTVILEKKPMATEMTVVLINEDVGLGWDPTWDESRINCIRDSYYNHTWAFQLPGK